MLLLLLLLLLQVTADGRVSEGKIEHEGSSAYGSELLPNSLLILVV